MMNPRHVLGALRSMAAILAVTLMGGAVHAQSTANVATQSELNTGQPQAKTQKIKKFKIKLPLKLNFRDGTSIELYGYVKGDLISDTGFNLGSTTQGLATIGLPGGAVAGNFARGLARQSRFGLNFDGGDFKAKIESDFYGASGVFRLRHAYGEYKGLLVGQTWTNFMPLASYPNTVDFQGPAGLPFGRVRQIRYTYKSGAGLTLSGSIEDDPTGSTTAPSFTAAANYDFEQGSVRIAGISRDINVAGTPLDSWGVTIGTNLQLWQGGTVQANYTQGDALSDILVFGLSGNAQFVGGRKVSVEGITLGLSQDVNDRLTVGFAFGRTELDRAFGIDTKQLETLHLNAIYKPTKNLRFGIEYFTGTRTQGNDIQFDAHRVQLMAQFNF